jgi:hypothetical protein
LQNRNNDGNPHWSNGSYHVTIDWRWQDENGNSWQKTCHATINPKTGEREDDIWFDTRPM